MNNNGKQPTPLIKLANVDKTYPTSAGDYVALKNINLSIASGEFAAVVGKSGSGKSTLLNLITGIDRATSGEVIVGDTMLHNLTENQLAIWRGKTVGIVFQFFQLLPTLSVIENVMLPMDFSGMVARQIRKARALALLDSVGIADHADKLPSALSGGQQQRVAIARALANDPALLVADEPTGNLDTQTSEAIFELFMTLVQQGKTILMVTHEQDVRSWATRTITLEDGRMLSDSIWEDVSNAQPALA